MTQSIEQEKVAYVSPGDTKWCVSVRDGTALSDGLFTVRHRTYHESIEAAQEAAERRKDNGRVDRVELNVVARRFLENND